LNTQIEEFDAFGNRINELRVCREWRRMHDASAAEGLISIGYQERSTLGKNVDSLVIEFRRKLTAFVQLYTIIYDL